jgi:hypothetical protein
MTQPAPTSPHHRPLSKKIKGLLVFPIYYPLAYIWNVFLGYNFDIHYNPIDELKYILRD